MRYLIRLIDTDLRGLTRELAVASVKAAESVLAEPPPVGLYRPLYRAIQRVLEQRVTAYRFCGLGASCGRRLEPTELGEPVWTEKFSPEPERIRIYVMEPETAPSLLVGDLMRETLRAVAAGLPRRRLKGLARLLRRQVEKVLHGRVLRSDFCGEVWLCGRNEPYDAWHEEPLAGRTEK